MPWPNIPIPSDSYQIWLAQNQGSNSVANIATARSAAASIIGGVAAAGATMAGGWGALGLLGAARDATAIAQAGGGLLNAMTSVQQNQARYQDAQAMPDHIRGLDAESVNYAFGHFGFTLFQTCIRREMAESIDEFWTRFGYPINKVGMPHPNERPKYTYIKAPDVNVTSRHLGNNPPQGVPQWCMDGWKRSFAQGITFWIYDRVMEDQTTYGIYNYWGNGR